MKGSRNVCGSECSYTSARRQREPYNPLISDTVPGHSRYEIAGHFSSWYASTNEPRNPTSHGNWGTNSLLFSVPVFRRRCLVLAYLRVRCRSLPPLLYQTLSAVMRDKYHSATGSERPFRYLKLKIPVSCPSENEKLRAYLPTIEIFLKVRKGDIDVRSSIFSPVHSFMHEAQGHS